MSVTANYVTLNELCKSISVSPATGRNWLKLKKIIPQLWRDGAPLFTREYAEQLKSDIAGGKNRALKSRRNKKYVYGGSVYESYVSAGSPSVQKVRHLVEALSARQSSLCDMELRALLAECAMQMILRREMPAESLCTGDGGELAANPGTNVLSSYIRGAFSLNGYEFLIDDLLPDKPGALSFAEGNADLFATEYPYEGSEDVLGLLYISCKNLGSRKATGSYYTPTSVVRKVIGRLFRGNRAEGKSVFDPCCGTGNFLLQLPETVAIENIYGNDIDELSVCIARINLALKYRTTDREILYGHFTAEDYLMSGRRKQFDYIIGNPPWGYCFTEEEKGRLREKYSCAVGKNIESYDVVTEQAVSELKCNGILSFVLPESILNVKSHINIREFLMEGNSFQYLEYLGDVFHGVCCPGIILQIQHNGKTASCAGMTVKEHGRSFTIMEERRINKEYFNFTATDEEYRILRKIEHVPQKATLAGRAKFALGIVTGNNSKYITKVKADENEIVLKGTDIHKFRFTESGNYITYKPQEFQQAAPTEYYRAPQKLLYRFISNQLVFAYDDRKTLSLNSCNVLIPQIEGLDIKYILAVLNSRAAQFYFVKNFRSVKVLRSHIEQIPIPVIGREEQEEIIQIAGRLTDGPGDGADGDFELLDAMVAELFGLSQEEYEIVKNSAENA